MSARVVALVLTLFSFGCQHPPPLLSVLSNELGEHYVTSLRAKAQSLAALRGTARVSIDGRLGESFSKQLLLLQKPASLRVEVIGILNQRIAILATNGVGYDLYQREGNHFQSGVMGPDILFAIAGVPLTPEQAVAVLLGVPASLVDAGVVIDTSKVGTDRIRVGLLPNQNNLRHDLEFDRNGRLRLYRFKKTKGETFLEVRYDDFRKVGNARFAHSITLYFPGDKARARLSFREVELNPDLKPELFRLWRAPG